MRSKGPGFAGAFFFVMPGHSSLPCADYVYLSALPGIHVFIVEEQDVDGRNKSGHDDISDETPP